MYFKRQKYIYRFGFVFLKSWVELKIWEERDLRAKLFPWLLIFNSLMINLGKTF